MDKIAPFIQHHPYLIGAAVVLIIVLIVDEIVRRVQGQKDVGPNDAIRLINRGATVVDVRDSQEFTRGHIAEARNIPLEEIGQQADKIGKDNGVLLYCDEGKTGARATRILTACGHEQVFNLKGGLAAWQRDNLPVIRGKK